MTGVQTCALPICIAKTLLHDPQLLILDEPANGLDPYARIEMRETILRLKEMGKTLMVSSHILPELGSVCDQVGIIEKGALLKQGTLDDIISSMQQNIVLELNVISDAETAAACALELPTVNDVTFSGNDMRLDFVGSRDQIADLNDHLVENGVRLIALREAEVDLEQVFLSVTGKDDKRDMGTASKPGPDATRQQSQPGQTQRNPAVSKNQGINAAMQQARDNLQEFIKVLLAPEEDEHDFAVKKLFRRDGEEDLLWVVDLDFDGTVFNGVLRNGSKKFPDLAKGTEVAVDVRELPDWMYVAGDLLIGGYTIRLIYSRLPEDRKEAFLRKKPYSVIE